MIAYVTGDEGFIAGYVRTELAQRGHTATGCDLKSGQAVEDVPLISADATLHLAAIACARHPDDDEMWEQNLGVTAAVVRASTGHIVFASTCAAYRPLASAYGGAKWAAEHLVLARGGTVLRFANVYGAGQRDTGHEPGVLAAWAKAHREGRPLRIDGDGSQTRDFIHASDVARAVVLAAEKRPRGIFDICTGKQTSIAQAAATLYPDDRIAFAERDPRDADHTPQDPGPALAALGFSSQVEL